MTAIRGGACENNGKLGGWVMRFLSKIGLKPISTEEIVIFMINILKHAFYELDVSCASQHTFSKF